jgi:hypothetical protein
MQLKEFISSTLIEIYEGIKTARLQTNNVIATQYWNRGAESAEKEINFKLYIYTEDTASNEKNGHVGGGIKVLSGHIDSKNSDSSKNARYHEINFSVPYNPHYFSIEKK